MLRVYAKELEIEYFRRETPMVKFHDILGQAFRRSSDLRIRTCQKCGLEIKAKNRWIATPRIFAINIVWDPLDLDFTKFLVPTFRMYLDPRQIFDAEVGQDITENYVFRGMVCFHYNHYSTFIFIPEENSWYQIDDSFIKKIENFISIIQMMKNNESIPVLLLYEHDYGQLAKKNEKKTKKTRKRSNRNGGNTEDRTNSENAENRVRVNDDLSDKDRSCLSCEIF